MRGLRSGRRGGSLLLAVSLALTPATLVPTRAAAADSAASARANARRLVLEGDALYAKQNYAPALARYSEAYRLMRVPTVGVEVVKAQEALGQIIEAARTAEEVSALPKQPNEPAVFADARLQAAQDALRLNALTPTLLLDVAPRGVLYSVQIDGAAPAGDVPFRVNPGAHRLRVSAEGYDSIELDVVLQQAERQSLTVTLFPLAGTIPPAASAPPEPAAAGADVAGADVAGADVAGADVAGASVEAEPALELKPEPQTNSTRTLGWVGLGVAGVGVLAGTFAGISAFSTKPDCPNDVCTPSQKEEIDSSKQMGYVADVSFGIAIVAGALGIWALAASSDDEPPESAAASPPRQAAASQPRPAAGGRVRVSSVDVASDRSSIPGLIAGKGSLVLRLSGSF